MHAADSMWMHSAGMERWKRAGKKSPSAPKQQREQKGEGIPYFAIFCLCLQTKKFIHSLLGSNEHKLKQNTNGARNKQSPDQS